MRRQAKSNDEWMQGLYIYHGINVALGNALSKKGSAKLQYMDEPIRVIPLTEWEKQEKAEAERKKLTRYLNKMAEKAEKANGQGRKR